MSGRSDEVPPNRAEPNGGRSIAWWVYAAVVVAVALAPYLLGRLSMRYSLDVVLPASASLGGLLGVVMDVSRNRREARADERETHDALQAIRDARRIAAETRGYLETGRGVESTTLPSACSMPPRATTVVLDDRLAQLNASFDAVAAAKRADGRLFSPQYVVLIVVALIGFVPAIITAVRKDNPPPDCLAYVQRLVDLEKAYPPARLDAALNHLHFDQYEGRCGDASVIITSLHQ